MKGGIFLIISLILIVIIVVALILLLYMWLMGLFPKIAEEEQIETTALRLQGCLRIEGVDIDNRKLVLRNCGPISLSDFKAYVDLQHTNSDLRSLDTRDYFLMDMVDLTEGEHEIFVISDYAESNTVKVTVGPPPSCDEFISSLPYEISQNNTYYCLSGDLSIAGETAIHFTVPTQNSTLDCLGYNLNGDKTDDAYGVLIGTFFETGNINNTVKNCKITNFDYGIFCRESENNTIINNIAENNNRGIYLSLSHNSTIYNNTAKKNIDGFRLSGSHENNLTNNIANYNSDYGFYLRYDSESNTLTDNTANNNYNGFFIFQSFYDTFANNTAKNNNYAGFSLFDYGDNNYTNNIVINNTYGFKFRLSYNNILSDNIVNNNSYGFHIYDSGANVTGGSIASSSTSDYYLDDAWEDYNYFRSTNFTGTRKIFFDDTWSYFHYNNATSDGIWLKTKVSASRTITRKLISWTQSLMQWNDSSSSVVTATYNITGLLQTTIYDIYNNSVLTYTLSTDSDGVLPSFTIVLPNDKREIKVQT